MSKEENNSKVTAIFDIGKTNKKFFLFDEKGEVLAKEITQIPLVEDEEGFPCEDLITLENWIDATWQKFRQDSRFSIQKLNFSTYGASWVYLDAKGKVLTPLYNYTKPYPEMLLILFEASFGNIEAISVETNSPVLGMLNAGLQLFWLQKTRPDTFQQIHQAIHFPNYLAYRFSKQAFTEITSLGCHTFLWDFTKNEYHDWVKKVELESLFPPKVPINHQVEVSDALGTYQVGIGIHDSSAALVPYLLQYPEPFILLSTGTWSIALNPFATQKLTQEELTKDCLMYLNIFEKPVKAARLFIGYEHEYQLKKLQQHYKVALGTEKSLQPDEGLIQALEKERNGFPYFSPEHIENIYLKQNFSKEQKPLTDYPDFEQAYTALMMGLTDLQILALEWIIEKEKMTQIVIDGGFADNPYFLYNLFVYISIQDRLYLYYVIYLAANLFLSINTATVFPESFSLISVFIAFLALTFFSYKFLRVKEVLGKVWNGIYIAMAIILLICLLAYPFLRFYRIMSIVSLATPIVMTILLISSIWAWRKKYKTARFFTLAFFFYILFINLTILKVQGVFGVETYITKNFILMGSVLEALFFAFALADRFNTLKKENLSIIQNQNKVLEENVLIRTKELQEAYEETQVMNEELRQTQEELQTQRDFVELQNKELLKTNQKLESSELILRKMNLQIKEKNKTLASTNNQIVLSMNSAKTIQEAILPYEGKFAEYFADYFIINRPKDVVSGDFYWFKESQGKVILVVADCTGHGVPGAFMTLIGANLLDKIVELEGVEQPSLILEKLHQEVQNLLKQKYTHNNNGMDAVVISLEKRGSQEKLIFAGAKNNILLWTNNEIKELKGTRKSIGGIQNEEIQFENQESILQKGDLIYLGSDGLEDQNNSKRKKFGRNRIKSIIQENHHLSLSEQKQKFEQALGQHIEGTLQRDDILWMGVRL